MGSGISERLSRLLLAACIFLNIAVIGYLQPFVPIYQSACGMSASQIGLIASLASLSMLIVQPLLGVLSDRIDRRRPLIIVSSLVSAAAYYGYANVHGLAGFILVTIIGVNGMNYVAIACSVIVGRLVSAPEQAGRAWSAYRVWGSIGYVIVSVGVGFWLAHNPAHSHLDRAILGSLFRSVAVVFACVAATAIAMPDPHRHADVPSTVIGVKEDRPPGVILSNDMLLFCGAYFLYSFAMSGLFTYLSLYMKWLGESSTWITGTFATGVIFEAIVMSRIGRWTDRHGRRPALVLSFLSLPVRILLYLLGAGPLWILCVSAMQGLNYGIMGATSIVFVNEIADASSRGAAQARLSAVSGLAASIAPYTAGMLVQHLGIHWMLGVMAVISAAGSAVFIARVKESHPSAVSIVDECPAYLRGLARLFAAPP